MEMLKKTICQREREMPKRLRAMNKNQGYSKTGYISNIVAILNGKCITKDAMHRISRVYNTTPQSLARKMCCIHCSEAMLLYPDCGKELHFLSSTQNLLLASLFSAL